MPAKNLKMFMTGDDARAGVALPDCAVAAGRDEARGQGLLRAPPHPRHAHLRRAGT